MAKNVGVLLSGCGYLDGSEVHEAVCTLLALDEAGAKAVCMAPNITLSVVDHLTGDLTGETRNVLAESARIARGKVIDLSTVAAEELDALILPGGYGAAKNLSDFATKGTGMSVNEEVARLVHAVHQAGKPIGFICIAPAIAAKLLPGVKLTIGNDPGTAAALNEMGGQHCDCAVTDFIVDEANKVVSTPAYMLGPWIKEVHSGISKCVREVLALAD